MQLKYCYPYELHTNVMAQNKFSKMKTKHIKATSIQNHSVCEFKSHYQVYNDMIGYKKRKVKDNNIGCCS